MAAVGYLGILCLIPLFVRRSSPYAQFHGKQGLVIFGVWIILWIGNIVPIIGQIAWVLGSLILLAFVVMGIIHALNGDAWEVPVLGKYARNLKG